MEGTSTVSSSRTRLAWAHPKSFFSSSADGGGVRSPTAMSLVMWSPPSGITSVCHTAPSRKRATSVVPPPMSIRSTPSSRSSGVSTDSPEASDCRTTSSTFRPARLTLRTTFWTAVRGPGDEVDRDAQPAPEHPDRLPDAVLVVDGEPLGEGVEDLAVGRQAHRPGGVHRPGDVGWR